MDLQSEVSTFYQVDFDYPTLSPCDITSHSDSGPPTVSTSLDRDQFVKSLHTTESSINLTIKLLLAAKSRITSSSLFHANAPPQPSTAPRFQNRTTSAPPIRTMDILFHKPQPIPITIIIVLNAQQGDKLVVVEIVC
jgi:hypothetical protein